MKKVDENIMLTICAGDFDGIRIPLIFCSIEVTNFSGIYADWTLKSRGDELFFFGFQRAAYEGTGVLGKYIDNYMTFEFRFRGGDSKTFNTLKLLTSLDSFFTERFA